MNKNDDNRRMFILYILINSMQEGSGQCIVNYTGTQKFVILIVGSETLGTFTKFLLVGSINDYASLPTDNLKPT